MKIQTFTKSYEGRRVLEVPELELEGGKIYGVIGANGSGKSTFAKVLAGVVQADIPGRKTEKGLRLGYMPQKNYAFRMSVRENIFLGKRDEKRAAELMEALGISHLADKRARLLSGGETARMALARLMMQDFRLLILDEPTAAMDMESSLLAEKLMGDYCRCSGCALVLITHSLQQPNQNSGVTGGLPQMIGTMARAGVAAGVDGLFFETHPEPAMAKSDGANMLRLDKMESMLKTLIPIRKAILNQQI